MSYWSKLSMKDRADVMKLFLDKGISDLDTMRREYNIFAEGGKIHIDPSKKGTFTAAASRHGMGVQEFASKVLANKENYSPAMVKKANFARNASKWHGFGGNLYGDGGSYSYTKPLDNVYVDSEGNLLDPNVPSARGSIRIPDVEVTANPIDVGRGKAARLYNDYGIASNDATSTPLTRNIHLNERGLDGATKAAAWMKDNPTLNNVGMALGATPFAVAGYPAFMAAGEGTATALANPYVDAALTSGFGAHGLQKLANGEADWSTALEITPLGRLARPMWNAGKEAVYNIADRYMFMPHQNSFTRGIGGEAGLQDLVESGLVRGNPIGTEVTAKAYGKLTRSNRNNFNDIMRDTGIDNIAHRYYNRTLTEEDFNAIKKAAQKYKENTPSSGAEGRITLLRQDKDPLSKYSSYQDYQAQLTSDRQTLANATSLDDSGQPLAYFYDDGRNPLTAGHDYAASDYGVRINNASEYNPRIFDGHLHYSMPEAVPLRDPNVEVFKKGPFGLTYRLNKETMKPVWQRDLKTLFSKGTNKAPQITAENAAKNSSIMADANDFSYKGLTSDMSDFFEKMTYSNKIHGKPMVPSDEGVGGFSKSVQVGIPKTEYDELLHDVVGRNIREFKQAGLSDAQVSNYINNAKDAMDNVHIGMYSDSDYIKGGWEGFGGFYDSEGNFISVNTGSPLPKTKVVKHEGRHLLDHKVDDEILMPASENFGKDFDSDIALSTMQKVKQNQNMTLYDAYDNDFMTLPSKEGFNEGLEGYSNMDREAITTNLDSRNELLGSKAGWDLDITDKIIDKMPDTAIFDAVEKANGYGRRYIRFLRENNKLTPEKAKQFREAMKHVGAIATPVGIGYGLSQGNE